MATLTLAKKPDNLPPLLAKHLLEKALSEKAAAERRVAEAVRQQAPPAPQVPPPEEEDHAARKASLRREYGAIRQILRDRGIVVFDRYVPLAIGIRTSLVELLGDVASAEVVARFLWHHCTRQPYLEAVMRNEPRRHLDGTEAGPIAESERRYAGARLAWIKRRPKESDRTIVPTPST